MMDDYQKVYAQALMDLNKLIISFNEKELSMYELSNMLDGVYYKNKVVFGSFNNKAK
jgi:hypothetical protein